MKALLFFFTLFTAAILQAQKEADLYWSNELEFRRNAEYNSVVGTIDEYIVVLSSSGEDPVNSIDVSLDLYSTLTLEYKHGLSLVENKSQHNFEKIIITKDRLLIFTSYFDRQLNLNILAVQEYNPDKNSLSEQVRVDEVLSTGKEDSRPFVITSSPDQSLVLIYHENNSSTGNKLFNLKVIRNDFTTLWEKEIALNYKDKMVNFNKILLDNGSNTYLMSSINPFGVSGNAGLGSLLNVKNTLFTYRPYEDKIKEYEFALSRNWIDEVDMEFEASGTLIAMAYFTYPNDYKIRGFVMFELNVNTGEVEGRKMATLDKNQIRVIDESIGRLKEYSKALVGTTSIYPGSSSHMSTTSTEFIFKDLLVTRDGYVLAVEAFRRDERCNESFSDQQMLVDCQKHFLYGDALLFFLDKNCALTRISVTEKLQHSVTKLNSHYSYNLLAGKDEIFILYNDDYRNLEESGDYSKMPLTNLNKATLSVKIINNRGDLIPYKINTQGENDIPFFPSGETNLSDTEFLLYSQKEKNYKFGKLSIH